MARGVLVLVAVIAGGLVGLAVGPVAWSVLEDMGVVAWPVCNDVFVNTVSAICARPRSMDVFALATATMGATVAGTAVWRILRAAATTPAGHDATD